MAADNTVLSAAVGTGDTIRDFNDTGNVKWPAGVACYVTGGSANAWTLAPVDITHGLPVQPMTGATFAVSAAALPLPSGAASAANQLTEITGLASILSALGGTLTVAGSISVGNFPSGFLAAQSGTWTVGISAAQTIAVTNAGTFAVQAAQSGTWNITNVSGTVSLPTGASTEATLSALNAKVTAVNTGAVVISAALPAGSNVIGHVITDSGSVVTATLSAETTKVIGTVNQGTSPWVVSMASTTITGTVAATQSGTWTVGLSAAQTLATVTSLSQFAGAAINLGNGASGTGTLRVTLANDSTGIVSLTTSTASIGKLAANSGVTIGAVEIAAAQTLATVTTVSAVTSLTQFNGNAIDTNSGNKSAGTLRVVLATDQPALTNKLLVTPDANSAVNVAQMNGVTVTMNNGAAGTGVQRVTIANDSTGILAGVTTVTTVSTVTAVSDAQVQGKAATDAVASGNPVLVGGVARRARITAMSADGDAVSMTMDRYGRAQIVGVDLTVTFLQVTASGDTDLVAAPSAGSRLKLLRIEASNSHATTALTVGLKSASIFAGAVFGKKYLPAVGGLAVWTFPNGHLMCGDAEKLVFNLSGAGQIEVTAYYETVTT